MFTKDTAYTIRCNFPPQCLTEITLPHAKKAVAVFVVLYYTNLRFDVTPDSHDTSVARHVEGETDDTSDCQQSLFYHQSRLLHTYTTTSDMDTLSVLRSMIWDLVDKTRMNQPESCGYANALGWAIENFLATITNRSNIIQMYRVQEVKKASCNRQLLM